MELALAMKVIREHGDEWNVDVESGSLFPGLFCRRASGMLSGRVLGWGMVVWGFGGKAGNDTAGWDDPLLSGYYFWRILS